MKRGGFTLRLTTFPRGADYWEQTGRVVPEDFLESCVPLTPSCWGRITAENRSYVVTGAGVRRLFLCRFVLFPDPPQKAPSEMRFYAIARDSETARKDEATSLTCPPVIIIGMHRSGTAMISRMLEELGLFVGAQKDPNNEALFFLRLNDWLIRSTGGRWDYPLPILVLLKHPTFRELIEDYLHFTVGTPRIVPFLGLRHYLRHRSLHTLNFPWGWKDPRNTFTLPLWLRVFPNARVVHVLRHGVDVANSLLVRHQMPAAHLAQARARYYRLRWLYAFKPMRTGFGTLNRTIFIEEAFALWEEYVRQARMHVNRLECRAVEVRFESFLENPQRHLRKLADFCGLEAAEADIARAAAKADPKRAFAFRAQPRLKAFAEKMEDRLTAFGY